MGQYKLSFTFGIQIGLMFKYEPRMYFYIGIPFIDFYYGLTDTAQGVYFFKD